MKKYIQFLYLLIVFANGCATVSENFVRNCDAKMTVNCFEKLEDGEKRHKSADVTYWQSYSFGSYKSEWNKTDKEIEILDLGKLGDDFNSVYGYIRNGKIVIDNVGGARATFRIDERNSLVKYYVYNEDKKNKYERNGRVFFSSGNKIFACKLDNLYDCESIDIAINSFPYLFGGKGANSIIGTNYGEVIGFIDNKFCRMAQRGGFWECADNPMLNVPRGFQLYSFISIDDDNLIGSWPNGTLYTFDGQRLYEFMLHPDNSANYEAQSMAFYCGDIYIGYWPRGELYKFDKIQKKLTYVKRFFSDSVYDVRNIPYAGRLADGDPAPKYGQRITSLVPYGDSLYLFTGSDHGDWGKLNSAQIDLEKLMEYGKVYRLRKPQCTSVNY